MAIQTSLPALLASLTQSLDSALEATPKLAGIEPPTDGVSLLNVKNELLLSYLQNLVFLILLKIRNAKSPDAKSLDKESALSSEVVEKLVELRLYLEKGVRPLEDKLRFQLDKILRSAEDAERNAQRDASNAEKQENETPDSDSEEDETPDSDKMAGPGFNFIAGKEAVGMAAATKDKTGVYRPPKFAPTVMPTTERREARDRRPMKSATMDEYISNELSAAPVAEPSVGTNFMAGGRTIKTATQRAEEDRRREYEESNFTRLAPESKKDRAARKKAEGKTSKMQFGGEDWRDLGEGASRIDRLTKRSGGSSGTKALLDKSRKRGRDTTDSARGSGLNSGTREIGDHFQKRLKVMEGGRRDRGKR
ncbi:hypothetical protein LQW54_005710 [Pestalotiopsis sp. IQ-011]